MQLAQQLQKLRCQSYDISISKCNNKDYLKKMPAKKCGGIGRRIFILYVQCRAGRKLAISQLVTVLRYSLPLVTNEFCTVTVI
jgi:hypothetical protein